MTFKFALNHSAIKRVFFIGTMSLISSLDNLAFYICTALSYHSKLIYCCSSGVPSLQQIRKGALSKRSILPQRNAAVARADSGWQNRYKPVYCVYFYRLFESNSTSTIRSISTLVTPGWMCTMTTFPSNLYTMVVFPRSRASGNHQLFRVKGKLHFYPIFSCCQPHFRCHTQLFRSVPHRRDINLACVEMC